MPDMNKPIQAGDLVMAVRGHSCVLDKIGGVPFRVRAIVPVWGGGWQCKYCGTFNLAPDSDGANLEGLHKELDKGIPLVWLKKIPPIGELDDVKRDEEITA